MQYVPEGPDIPVEVLDEQENGNLVFFCGAGVSASENLPIFSQLVGNLRDQLCDGKFPFHIEEEFDKGNYDRVMTFLDKKYTREQVLTRTFKQLSTPEKLNTKVHESIITLSKSENGKGKLKLVTTNFDLIFEKADSSIIYHEAPALPVAKPYKWNSLVYLHGRMNDDLTGNNIVINTGDFGLAYLFEGWATRFITELFRHFTVLFIGYSVDDPIMRYIIDALASEREKGIQLKKSYALAHFSSKKEKSQVKEKWLIKNINPILFNKKNGFKLLYDTLEAWSSEWSGGWEAKQSIILRNGLSSPSELHERQIDEFLYALSDPTGKASEKLVEAGKNITPEWINYIEKSKYWISDIPELSDGEEIFYNDFFLGLRPRPFGNRTLNNIANWLVSDLTDLELIKWVVSKRLKVGVFVIRRLEFKIQEQIKISNDESTEDSDMLDQIFITFWLMVIDNSRTDNIAEYSFHIEELLHYENWGTEIQNSLKQLLKSIPSVSYISLPNNMSLPNEE